MTGSSSQGIKTVLHPVSDLAGQHIGLVPGGGPQRMTSPVACGEALLMATPTDRPPAGTGPPPGPFGWGWPTPATRP